MSDKSLKCCVALGIPLALEKLEGPSTLLSFLGIVIDMVHMQLLLPQDKLQRITDLITTWLCKKSATKREICDPICENPPVTHIKYY